MPAGSFPWMQPTTSTRRGAPGSPRTTGRIARPSTLCPIGSAARSRASTCIYALYVRTAAAGPRPLSSLQVAEDLVRGAHALRRAALHEPLEVRRAVLAGEVDVPLAHALVAAEADVLAGLPVGVRAVEVRVRGGRRKHRLAVPLRRDAGEDVLQIRERLLCERGHLGVRRRRRVRVRL